MSGYNPNRIIHYRLEGKHARPLCKCKLPPNIRPRLLPRTGGVTLPLPIKPEGEGLWSGTCARCYELAQALMAPRTPPPSPPLTQYERDVREAEFYARVHRDKG